MPANLDCPQWRGEPVAGKRVLVWGEQGAGDTIQFARYIRRLRERGAVVWLSCYQQLRRLLVPLVEGDGENATEGFDYHAPVMSLPLALGDIEPIWDGPYITADDDNDVHQEFARDARLRVGLCWKGNPFYNNDRNRSIPVESFEALRMDGVVFYSLQHGEQSLPWMVNLINDCRDYADTAALIANLDLVITVDTSVAHLAGAMGKPVWIVMPERGA
jgi:hypothetical protein